MWNSKSKDDNVLQNFQNQKINQLCLIKKGKQGITYPMLQHILITNIDSNGENLFQALGRGLLLDFEDKVTNIYIFVSNESFQLNWLNKSLEGIDKNKIVWEKV
jgi:superfamily II DNA or RNA helicase